MDVTLEERLDFIEFRQELLFSNTELDRCLFENKINRQQYNEIMNLMDEIRKKIYNHEEVSSAKYEERIFEILPEHNGEYHLAEEICKDFYALGRWEEVFVNLYGDSKKFQSYLNNSF